jgi:hypothetical protein
MENFQIKSSGAAAVFRAGARTYNFPAS